MYIIYLGTYTSYKKRGDLEIKYDFDSTNNRIECRLGYFMSVLVFKRTGFLVNLD